MTRTAALSVVLLVSAIFTGCMMSAHAAAQSVEQPAVSSASQGSCEEASGTQGYWAIWATATAQ